MCVIKRRKVCKLSNKNNNIFVIFNLVLLPIFNHVIIKLNIKSQH